MTGWLSYVFAPALAVMAYIGQKILFSASEKEVRTMIKEEVILMKEKYQDLSERLDAIENKVDIISARVDKIYELLLLKS